MVPKTPFLMSTCVVAPSRTEIDLDSRPTFGFTLKFTSAKAGLNGITSDDDDAPPPLALLPRPLFSLPPPPASATTILPESNSDRLAGDLVGAGSHQGSDRDVSAEGIVQGHAYAVLRVAEETDADGARHNEPR